LSLDIPDQVRKTVIADGNESWLDELPGVVDSLNDMGFRCLAGSA
jgi:streptomycin 6-kinase